MLPFQQLEYALADTFCVVTVLQEQKEREHEERLKQKQWEAQRGVAQKQAEERCVQLDSRSCCTRKEEAPMIRYGLEMWRHGVCFHVIWCRHKLERQAMERNARMFEDKQRLRDEHDAIFEERLEVEPTNARDIVSGDNLYRRRRTVQRPNGCID